MMLWRLYCAQTRVCLGHNDVAIMHRGIAITHHDRTHPSFYLLQLSKANNRVYYRTYPQLGLTTGKR